MITCENCRGWTGLLVKLRGLVLVLGGLEQWQFVLAPFLKESHYVQR